MMETEAFYFAGLYGWFCKFNQYYMGVGFFLIFFNYKVLVYSKQGNA